MHNSTQDSAISPFDGTFVKSVATTSNVIAFSLNKI